MTDDRNPRRVDPKGIGRLYSNKQSDQLKIILSGKEGIGISQEAWVSKFEKFDKRVKSRDKKKATSIEETELERLSQTNKLRGPFMYIALGMVGVIILVSSVVVLRLAWLGQLETPMGVAFTVTLGIEVVGILAIIAHYLFSVPESYLLEKVKLEKAKASDNRTDGQDE
ncbi:hypothetical protein [Corynebacterium sp.]|uniref:hypothetical protein n=1 Tax=Corynebacterium sp. TaxID=1720 RepID=UPI0028AD9A61|nr:hypothetical protein [Corynebacterium sp.]